MKKVEKQRQAEKNKRKMLYAKCAGRCSICGKPIQNKNQYDKDTYMTIDHIFPKSMGGTNDFNNLQGTCYQCNQEKSNCTPQVCVKNNCCINIREMNQ